MSLFRTSLREIERAFNEKRVQFLNGTLFVSVEGKKTVVGGKFVLSDRGLHNLRQLYFSDLASRPQIPVEKYTKAG